MSRRTTVAVCCALSSVLLVTAPAQAAKHKRVTARERAEAAQLMTPMKEFKAAADARNAEVTAAIVASEAEERRCPPPRGVPSGTPRTYEGFTRLATSYFADYYHRLAAGTIALRPELNAARDRYRAMHLRTREFRTLARSEAADLDVLVHLTSFDLCAFWTAWEGDGLDFEKGFDRLAKLMAVGDREGGGWAFDELTRLQHVAGSRVGTAWLGFPMEGRFAPKPLREELAGLDHLYDDFWDRFLGDSNS
jgi:hypothetical protein